MSLNATGKKAIVAGATGSVGQLIVQTLLGDPRIEHVTAVVRKQISEDKAKTIWGIHGHDAKKISQLTVDYEDLVTKPEGAMVKAAKEAFQNNDAFLTGLGVYSSSVSEAEMDTIESYNVSLAKIAADCGAKRGAYLSGGGVKQPELEGESWAKFGRSKGRAEEALAKIFVDVHVSCRPGGIFDRPGPPIYGFVDGYLLNLPLFNWMRTSSFGITAVDVAKGMVQGALFEDAKGNVIWENNAVREAARRYDASVPKKA